VGLEVRRDHVGLHLLAPEAPYGLRHKGQPAGVPLLAHPLATQILKGRLPNEGAQPYWMAGNTRSGW
jgi:hypothetical protein